MEIEETFSSLNEIQTVFEKDKMTWRISIDDEEDEREKEEIKDKRRKENKKKCETKKIKIESLKSVSFSTDADKEEIEKWEQELPDIEENGNENENGETGESGEADESGRENEITGFDEGNILEDEKIKIENAAIVYFDLFKNKRYVKTLIFQKEEDGEKEEEQKEEQEEEQKEEQEKEQKEEKIKNEKRYRLIGFCEAPMH